MKSVDQSVSEFNARVHRDWAGDETAAAWQKFHPQMTRQLAAVTAALVEAARPQAGMDVLDLASGTGEPSISLARRVAPGGSVIATDFSPGMLAALRSNADAAGAANILTQVCDAHDLPFEDGTFDRVTSRFGVMFFGDVGRALSEVRRVLRPGGRAAFAVWGPPEPGSYFGAAVVPFLVRLPQSPDPDGPGPMRFAEKGKLAQLFDLAGFTAIEESADNYPAPYDGSPEELLACMMEIAAPFRSAVASLPPADREAATNEALANLRVRFDGSQTRVTAPILIVTAQSQ